MKNYMMRKLSIMHSRMCENPRCRECHPKRADHLYHRGGKCEFETHPGPSHDPIEAPQIWFNQAKVDLILERLKVQKEGGALEIGPMPADRTSVRQNARIAAAAATGNWAPWGEPKWRPERNMTLAELFSKEPPPSWRSG